MRIELGEAAEMKQAQIYIDPIDERTKFLLADAVIAEMGNQSEIKEWILNPSVVKALSRQLNVIDYQNGSAYWLGRPIQQSYEEPLITDAAYVVWRAKHPPLTTKDIQVMISKASPKRYI